MNAKRVLIVDDRAINREILRHYCKDWNASPTCATNAAAGLGELAAAAAAGRPFDCAIIDMKMPGRDGSELLQDIRANEATAATPVLLLSSLVSTLPTDKASDPTLRHLSKPVRRIDLWNALAGMLQSSGDGFETPGGKIALRQETFAHRHDVLLVEDNPVNLEVAAETLRRLGCNVDTAMNGQEALVACAARHYDLVLMDCQMPVMDGFEATRAIRERERKADGASGRTPIVALTANAMDTDRAACREAGMDGFLSKPFSREVMADTLGRHLRSRIAVPASTGGSGADGRRSAVAVAGLREGNALDPKIVESLRSGRPELWPRLITLFAEETELAQTKLATGLGGGDSLSIKLAAHRMKSAAANVGAVNLSNIYRRLEAAAANCDLSACAGLSEQAQIESEHVSQAMNSSARDRLAKVVA